MSDLYAQNCNCPQFLFDPARREGQLRNPVTGLVELEFPRQRGLSDSYALHPDSELSTEFAGYLYYLVQSHILFTPQTVQMPIIVEACEESSFQPLTMEDDTGQFEYSTVWYRSTFRFMGLPEIYDCLGFCFLDRALYKALYCEVIEVDGLN